MMDEDGVYIDLESKEDPFSSAACLKLSTYDGVL